MKFAEFLKESTSNQNIILHINDWNMQDKYYSVEPKLLKEFLTRATKESMEDVWDWFIGENVYVPKPDNPKEHKVNPKARPLKRIDTNLEQVFFDYNDPEESAKEALEILAEILD